MKIEFLAEGNYPLWLFPKDDDTWHAYVVHGDKLKSGSSLLDLIRYLPCTHIVGQFSDTETVVVVASRIQKDFCKVYGRHLSPVVQVSEDACGQDLSLKAQTGEDIYGQNLTITLQAAEDVFLAVLKPPFDAITKYGFQKATEKTRSNVLDNAVRGITYPGRRALREYYRKIITNNHNLLPIEWAVLGYDLKNSRSEVHNKFTFLSLFLELHFLEDLNSDHVSRLLENQRHDGWIEYLEHKAAVATATVVENVTDEMHELSLVRGLLGVASNHTHGFRYWYDQEKTIHDSLSILGRVLQYVLELANTKKSCERRSIPRPLGAKEVRERLVRPGYSNSDISDLCAQVTILLPIEVPIGRRETLPATLTHQIAYKVLIDTIRVIGNTYNELPGLEKDENDTPLLLLHLVKRQIGFDLLKRWMTSIEGQRLYSQTLISMREEAQSVEQCILSLNTLRAYSFLLDPFATVSEPVYASNLCDFSRLLHGDKVVNKPGVLEKVATFAQRVLSGLPAALTWPDTAVGGPASKHWCDGSIERYWEHRLDATMTHREAYRKTCLSLSRMADYHVQEAEAVL